MADQTLLMLVKDVRGKTLKLLEGLSEEAARFAAPGLQNSILWHAGHAWIVNEALGISAATGGQPPVYPEGWFEMFGWKSQPATVTAWPALTEVVERLIDQRDRLVSGVEALSPADLDQIADPARGRTVRYKILHGLHDEANHQGEMWLIRKLYDRRQQS